MAVWLIAAFSALGTLVTVTRPDGAQILVAAFFALIFLSSAALAAALGGVVAWRYHRQPPRITQSFCIGAAIATLCILQWYGYLTALTAALAIVGWGIVALRGVMVNA